MLDVLSIPIKNTTSNSISDVLNDIKIFPGNFERGFLERKYFFWFQYKDIFKTIHTSKMEPFAKIVYFRALNTPLKYKEIIKL